MPVPRLLNKKFFFIKIFFFPYSEKRKKPIATNRNLNAKAEKGSLLLTIGFVVTNAEDQRTMNIIGKSLTIRINKLSCFFKIYSKLN